MIWIGRGALQQAFCFQQISISKRLANSAAAEAATGVIQQWQHLHRHVAGRTKSLQIFRAATAAVAKAKVFTNHHRPGLQLVAQHLLHKLLWAQGRQLQIKGHQHQLLDAQRAQHAQLFLGQIQPQPRFACQHLTGMGPKRQHRWHQGWRASRHGHSTRDHMAVPGVDAIKTAER